MPFVKLDTKILDSTLWVERECREIFITALLMAEPAEVSEPMECLKVRTLEPLGFTVPEGWYGFVHAAGPGIIRRASVPEESGMEALEKLSSPDLGSRSSDYEGRRMVRVDGGYLILNYMKYRERDYTAAERQRRLRERKRVTRDAYGVTPQHHAPSRIADADADTDAEADTEEASALFSAFWSEYPRHEKRVRARYVWVKNGCEERAGEIMAALRDWKRSEQWADPRYVPYAVNWIEDGLWKQNPQVAAKRMTKREQARQTTKETIAKLKSRSDSGLAG